MKPLAWLSAVLVSLALWYGLIQAVLWVMR